jgi:putative SOS response-associated peptidase YedK
LTTGGDKLPLATGAGAPPLAPRYNIAPTQTVITVTDDGARRIEQMRWGLIPRWAKDAKIGSSLINARAETLAEKPSFRNALRRNRCLIPADGFYEWTAGSGGRRKRPLRVTLRSGEPFAFAGLWDEWTPPDGQPPLRTCTIVTTTPNELMAQYHHRMPVILTPETEAIWLDPEVADLDRLLALLVPYPAKEMTAYYVSDVVNSAANDVVQCVLPLEEAS